jgi:hypothetical protein
MTVLPLDQIRFGWQSHLSALWWLFLLYRRPKQFENALSRLPRFRRLLVAIAGYVHAIPWIVLTCVAGQLALGSAGIVDLVAVGDTLGVRLWWYDEPIGRGIAIGSVLGIAFGIILGSVGGITTAITLAIAFGITFGTAVGTAFGIAGGIVGDIAFAFAVGIFTGIAIGIIGGILTGIVGGRRGIYFGGGFWIAGLIVNATMIDIYGGIAFMIGFIISFMIVLIRIYYLSVVGWMAWLKPRGRWYLWHPVAWDDLCSVPFPGLHRLLVAYFEHDPEAARREIERLIDTYPSQRWQALKAKVGVVARDAAKLSDLSQIPDILAALPQGDDGFLRQVPRLRELAAPIAERQRQFDQAAYPTVRKQLAEFLIQDIASFRDQIAGFEEPLASEFRATAARWVDLARSRFAAALADPVSATTQLFRAGDPVNREQEAFVSRTPIVAEVESQVLLATGCPGLILYGRRRMGKSTVLRNLTGFLPPTVSVGYVSMQNPEAFASLAGFCGTVAGAARAARRWDTPPPENPADLSGLMRFLAWCNDHLGRDRLILALDEYEMIDTKIGEGVFGPDLLATLRESIASHRAVTWVLAGSHEISELAFAEWSSYLVSARTVPVPPFTPAETRQLLTDPVRHSGLWRHDGSKRPRFAAEFWGDGGIDRIHADAGGWPHLVQLLAETAVDMVNAEGTTAVSDEMYRRVREKAIVRGDTVLRQLVEKECRLSGEWEYLSRFRRVESQPPPEDESVYRSLRRRLLVEEAEGDWRLRVPLMSQWLRERG